MELSNFSTSDLIRELMNRNDVLSVTVWTVDNLKDRIFYLIESGRIERFDVTEEFLERIRHRGCWDDLGQESQNDWDVLDDAIFEAVKEYGTD